MVLPLNHFALPREITNYFTGAHKKYSYSSLIRALAAINELNYILKDTEYIA